MWHLWVRIQDVLRPEGENLKWIMQVASGTSRGLKMKPRVQTLVTANHIRSDNTRTRHP